VNGHVYPQVINMRGDDVAQRPMLFHNLLGKKFDVVPPVEGTGLGGGDSWAWTGCWISSMMQDGCRD